MALVRTNQIASSDTTARTTYTTASFSVAAGDLIIAFFSFGLSSASATLPIIGSTGTTLTGITWTQIATTQWAASNTDRITAWYGVCSGASTGVLTFIVPTAQGAIWSVFTYTGHDTGAPVSAGLTLTETTQTDWGILDVSALTGSLTVWGVGRNTNVGGAGSHGGATLIHENQHAAPTRGMLTFDEAGENSPSVLWSSGTWTSGGIAFKIREPSAGITVTPASLSVAVTFGTPTLAFGGITITPGGIAVAVSFGAPTLAFAGAPLTVTPTGLSVPVAFGTPTTRWNLAPPSLTVPVSFGTLTFSWKLVPASAVVPVTLGTPGLGQCMVPPGLAVPVTFGNAVLSIPGAPLTVAPNSLTVAITFGTPTLGQRMVPPGVAVPVAFGTTRLASRVTVAGFVIPVSFGVPTFLGGSVTVSPAALVVAAAFGTPTLACRVTPPGLSVVVTFGVPTLDLVVVGHIVTPASLVVRVTFGRASIPGPPMSQEPGSILVGASSGGLALADRSGRATLGGGGGIAVSNGAGKVATQGPARVRL